MASLRKVAAALGGILVAFVIVVLLEFATPPADLRTDDARLVLERFQFRDEGVRFTQGTDIEVMSAVGVPVDLVLRTPANESVPFTLEERGTRTFQLDQEGTYALSSPAYPWIGMDFRVVSDNPFERFWDRIL